MTRAGVGLDQRVAPERPDRLIERRVVGELVGEQVAGDAVGGVEGAAGQQPLRRAGALLTSPEPVQRQRQGRGDRPAVAGLRPLVALELGPAGPEPLQVIGEGDAGLADERGGLRQGQRQVAQRLGEPVGLGRVARFQAAPQERDGVGAGRGRILISLARGRQSGFREVIRTCPESRRGT